MRAVVPTYARETKGCLGLGSPRDPGSSTEYRSMASCDRCGAALSLLGSPSVSLAYLLSSSTPLGGWLESCTKASSTRGFCSGLRIR